MVDNPSDRDTCLRTSIPTYRIFSYDGQLSLLEPRSNWRFGILAGLPSNRGHHYTLRVWAPLSYTGGLKGLDGGSKLLRYLSLRSRIPV